ncbi:hypothetical protein PQR71_32960, partial [Paraburkholderia fungorum]|uniref:hypothetical protein n=1 Tax=Paraburkholderia fungorum TaxID=134537 RepID=UPI0038BB9AE3
IKAQTKTASIQPKSRKAQHHKNTAKKRRAGTQIKQSPTPQAYGPKAPGRQKTKPTLTATGISPKFPPTRSNYFAVVNSVDQRPSD